MKQLGYIVLLIFIAFQVKPSISVISEVEVLECCEHAQSEDTEDHDASKKCGDDCTHFHGCNCICKCLCYPSIVKFLANPLPVKYFIKNAGSYFQYHSDFWHPPKIS